MPACGAPAPRLPGPRLRVLVVDNEEADRDLLVDVLAPLGFELRTAASGHDALDLVAAGFGPDAMFVDLAMPGIDGWETIRRARWRATPHGTAVAIVSANAFDKRLENDVGIAPEDFFVKPVRHSELLDWLERQLAIRWTDTAAAAGRGAVGAVALVRPSPTHLRALDEAGRTGLLSRHHEPARRHRRRPARMRRVDRRPARAGAPVPLRGDGLRHGRRSSKASA